MSGGTNEKDLVWAAYQLGMMLTMDVYGVGDKPVADNLDRLMDTLREIAEGKLTLFSGAADLTDYPNMDPALREYVRQNMNEVMRLEREAAKLIWDRYEMLAHA